jgi:hypothetical protein
VVKTQVKRHEMPQPVIRRCAKAIFETVKEFLQVALHEIEEQALLVWRVIIQRTCLNTHLLRNLSHRNGRIAMLRKEPQRGLPQFGAGYAGVRTCGARHVS